MLAAPEYTDIKADYDRISRKYFAKSYFFPADMQFANSDALFPEPSLSSALEAEYELQCRQLCYGSFPTWTEVMASLKRLRTLL